MKLKAKNVLLFIQPEKKYEEPVNDELTKKIEHAFENFVEDYCNVGYIDKKTNEAHIHHKEKTMGLHRCVCGKMSESGDYGLSIDGKIYYTNSLCVHYVRDHRTECPKEDLEIISKVVLP